MELDNLWAEPGDKVMHNEWMLNPYWQASALTEIGRADFTAHGSSATSMAYSNAATGTRTFIAWNLTAKPQTVQFSEGVKPLAILEVALHGMAKTVKAK